MREIEYISARAMLYWTIEWDACHALRDIKRLTRKALGKINDY